MDYEIKLSGERMRGIGDGLRHAYTSTRERLISALSDPKKSAEDVQKIVDDYMKFREMSEWWEDIQVDAFHG